MSRHGELRVDGARLQRRIEELGGIGDTGDGGVCRLALTDADRDGRDLVVTWMQELGLRVEVDVVGNVTGTWPTDSDEPPVMTGSHLDTVRTGGRYDGNLGVLAGLECLETLITAGVRPARPLAVGVFTGEEGARFAPDMLGSLVFVGGLAVEEALEITDRDGTTVGAELGRIGYAGPLPCPRPAPHAFVELHIEQGPVLESTGATIGAVTAVQGISWHELHRRRPGQPRRHHAHGQPARRRRRGSPHSTGRAPTGDLSGRTRGGHRWPARSRSRPGQRRGPLGRSHR